MKSKYSFFSIIVFLLFAKAGFGQITAKDSFENSFLNNTVYFGYPAILLDAPDFGIYLAYTRRFKAIWHIDYEFQMALAYGDYGYDTGWFSHNGGETEYGNLLAGFRIYVFKRTNKINVYANFLYGICYFFDKERTYDNHYRTESELIPGYSGGLYFRFYRNIDIGIAVESYNSIVFKAGIDF